MKKIIICIAALLIVSAATAQTTVKFNIEHLLKDKSFALNQASENNIGDTFNVSRLEYYISKISIIHDGGQFTEAKDVYLLVNASKELSADIGSYNITNVEGIKFYIGVNTPQNNADPSQWPTGHPLAPKSPSMHWGWTAGYRFIALEGKAGGSLNTDYALHGLGNNNYFPVQIPLTAQDVFGQLHITVKADYTRAIEGINVSMGLIVHSEEDEALKMLQNFKDYVFTSTTGAGSVLASVNSPLSPNAMAIYPNPSFTGNATLEITDETVDYTAIQVTDITGRVVVEQMVNGNEPAQIQLFEKGVYMVSLMNENNRLLTKKLLVQ